MGDLVEDSVDALLDVIHRGKNPAQANLSLDVSALSVSAACVIPDKGPVGEVPFS